MPTPRLGCRAAVVDGRIFVVGGYRAANGLGMTELEEYDPATDTWVMRAPMPTGRRRMSWSSVNGRMFAIGGDLELFGPALRTVEVYDPLIDAWTSGTDMPTERFGSATGVVGDRIYVIGGFEHARAAAATTVVEVYDPASDTWATRTPMPTRRGLQSAVVVDGKIYVIGGTDHPTRPFYSTVEVYDPATDHWQTLSDMPTARALLAAVVINESIVAIGGRVGGRPFSAVETYDLLTDTWTEDAGLPANLWDPASAVVNERVYLIGGAEVTPPPHPGVSTVLEYDATFVASLTISPALPAAGEEIQLDGTSSVVSTGRSIDEYRWDFGDGNAASGATVSHTYETPGSFEIRLQVTDTNGLCRAASRLLTVVEPPPVSFVRGDCNGDGSADIADAVCMLNGLFGAGGAEDCRAALNVNGDGSVDISDPVALLNFLFGGGPSPVAPFPGCGPGEFQTDEEHGCSSPAICR